MYGLRAPRVRILGCDVAGTVESVGAAVEAFAPGDEVYGDLCTSGFGSLAEYACAPEAALARKPQAMSYGQAAAIPQAAMLAVQALVDTGGVRAGHQVLLNGAGGGVGTFALQLARLHGAEVTVVDSGPSWTGCGPWARTTSSTTSRRTSRGRPTGSDLILDVRTDRSPLAYAAALRRGGTYATVGGDLSRLLQVFLVG